MEHLLRLNRSFETFEDHLRSNAVGPIMVAQKLLQTQIKMGTIVFMSSDSGSAANFRKFEDGYHRQSSLGPLPSLTTLVVSPLTQPPKQP